MDTNLCSLIKTVHLLVSIFFMGGGGGGCELFSLSSGGIKSVIFRGILIIINKCPK
jgi:hypothetical protein